MKLAVKAIGMCLILIFSALAGSAKASALKQRTDTLMKIHHGLFELKKRIRLERCDFATLASGCFPGLLTAHGNTFQIEADALGESDRALFSEYLGLAGMGDLAAECERLELYLSLFESQIEKARERQSRLSRLYRTSGLLIGLLICVMIL